MLKKGDYVKVLNTGLTGYIISKNRNNEYTLNINDKKVIINGNDFEKINVPNALKNANDVKINITKEYKEFNNELMIRHQTLEEALFNLEEFLNEAYFLNIKEVTVIHGKNGGILRKGVHDYLKCCPFVKSFRLGNYFEGSYGVTLVTLK